MYDSAMNGLLVINKPSGITSRAVVDRVQHWFPAKPRIPIGHAGTLDPLATGVLVLCVGSATRLIEYVQRMGKTYRAGIRLGAISDTDDADGTVQPVDNSPVPTDDQVRRALHRFVGEIDQVPPAHSAAHVEGQRAYKLARRGVEVDLKPRQVTVYKIEVLRYAYPDLEVVVECGKGTYIRSIARDLGQAMGTGGYIQTLQRTRIGPFRIEDSLPLGATPTPPVVRLLPMRMALTELPAVTLPRGEVRKLCQGQQVRGTQVPPGEELVVMDEHGEPAAVARWEAGKGVLIPVKVFLSAAVSINPT